MGKIINHRGASAYAPENTLSAFNKAYAMGGRFIEFDVMLSADGQPFVFHDDQLERTTNGKGAFHRMDSDKLRTLDAGSWFSKRFVGEKIPTLREVLMWLIEKDVFANIELKPTSENLEQTTVAVLSHLNCFWPSNKPLPLISSFDMEALILCRGLSPELPIGMLMHHWQENWPKQAKQLDCYSIHLNERIATQKRIHAMKSQGYQVYVYTVNRKAQALKLFQYGVDAVFSDYPDLLGSEHASLLV